MEDKVTILVKTFERPECCVRLIKSIRFYYPTIPIIVADDGTIHPNLTDFNVNHMILEFDVGLSAGRNEMLYKTTTPYFLLTDDDAIFTEKTKLENMVRILDKNTDIDLVGGHLSAGDWHGTLEKKEGALIIHRMQQRGISSNGFPLYDIVANFFMAKTASIVKVQWDNALKIQEHEDFFWRASVIHGIKITITANVSADHDHVSDVKYDAFRRCRQQFFIAMWKQKHGVNDWVINK